MNYCSAQPLQSEQVVKEALIQSALTKIDFDAIIVDSTERDAAIRFKKSSKDKSSGIVKTFNGVPVFIDCNPVGPYTQVKKIKRERIIYDLNGKRAGCFGSLNIAQRITKKGNKGNDALIIGDDKFHWWIKFQ